jgi:hypothetical protein
VFDRVRALFTRASSVSPRAGAPTGSDYEKDEERRKG